MGGLEDYKIVRCVGKGSFGKVYLCRHIRENRHYCMKCIKLTNIPAAERAACRHEVKLMQRLSHPNIVGYKDSFFAKRGSQLCIVMTYCDGGDLSERVKRQTRTGRRFKEDQILHWFVQIALGLHFMHENRVLHRDLKTQNIFLLGNGRLVLGDLGISKVLEGTQNFAQTCIGTPYYMSPELFKNKPYNHKSDVWALGCILYELCTLKHAFDAKSLNGLASKILKGTYPAIPRSYSTHTRKLVKDMLSKSPHQRPDLTAILAMPFIRKRVQNFMCDVIMANARPGKKRSLDSGTMVMRGAFLQAGGQMSGAAAGGAAHGGIQAAKDMMALQSQLEGLGMKKMIAAALRESGALSPSENEHATGNTGVAGSGDGDGKHKEKASANRRAVGKVSAGNGLGMPPRHRQRDQPQPVSVRDERRALQQKKDQRLTAAQRRARSKERDARDALRREKERKQAVENALEKLRKEREMRMRDRQRGGGVRGNRRRNAPSGRAAAAAGRQRQRVRSNADHREQRDAARRAKMSEAPKPKPKSQAAEALAVPSNRSSSRQGKKQLNNNDRGKSREKLLREKKERREAEFRREQQKIDARSKRRHEAAAKNRAQQLKQRGSKLRNHKRSADKERAPVERAPSADVLSGRGGAGVAREPIKPQPPRSQSSAANHGDRDGSGSGRQDKKDDNFADAPRRVRDLDLWDRKQKARIAAQKKQEDAAEAAKKMSSNPTTTKQKQPSTPDRGGKSARQWAKEKWKQENDKMGDILERHRRKRELEARRRKEVAKAAVVARSGGSGGAVDTAAKPETQHSLQERRAKIERERYIRRNANGVPAVAAQADPSAGKKGIRGGKGGNGGGDGNTNTDANGPKVINPFPSEMDKLRSASSRNSEAAAGGPVTAAAAAAVAAGNNNRRVASADTPTRTPSKQRHQRARTPSPPRSPNGAARGGNDAGTPQVAWAADDVAQMPNPHKVEGGLSAREQMRRRKAERQRLKDEETKRLHLEAAEQQRQERVRAKQKSRDQYRSNIPTAAVGFGTPPEPLSSPPAPSHGQQQPITPLPPIAAGGADAGALAANEASLERHADDAIDNWLPGSRYGSAESVEYSHDHFASKYDEGKVPEYDSGDDRKGKSGLSQPDFDSVADEAIAAESPELLVGDHDSYEVDMDSGISDSDDDNDFDVDVDEDDDAAEEELLAAKEAELRMELTQAESRMATLRASMAVARKAAGGGARVKGLNPEDDLAEEDGDTEDSSEGSGEGSRLDEEEEYEFEFDPEFDHVPSGHTFRVSRDFFFWSGMGI